jgi:hypothetical protein
LWRWLQAWLLAILVHAWLADALETICQPIVHPHIAPTATSGRQAENPYGRSKVWISIVLFRERTAPPTLHNISELHCERKMQTFLGGGGGEPSLPSSQARPSQSSDKPAKPGLARQGHAKSSRGQARVLVLVAVFVLILIFILVFVWVLILIFVLILELVYGLASLALTWLAYVASTGLAWLWHGQRLVKFISPQGESVLPLMLPSCAACGMAYVMVAHALAECPQTALDILLLSGAVPDMPDRSSTPEFFQSLLWRCTILSELEGRQWAFNHRGKAGPTDYFGYFAEGCRLQWRRAWYLRLVDRTFIHHLKMRRFGWWNTVTATAGACNTVPTSLRAQRQDGLQPDLNAVSLGTPFVPCGGGPHVTIGFGYLYLYLYPYLIVILILILILIRIWILILIRILILIILKFLLIIIVRLGVAWTGLAWSWPGLAKG